MDLINKNFNAIPETAFKKSEESEFDDVKVFLNITYKEIPKKSAYITFPVPHHGGKNSICIVIKDLDRDSEKSIKIFEKLIQKESIDKSEIRVLPLKELTLMQYEEKRKLAASHQIFLVDKRVAHRATAKLGKSVLKSHNHPIPVDFSDGVAKAIKFGQSHIRMALKAKGPNESVEIANLSMTKEHIRDNFASCVSCSFL